MTKPTVTGESPDDAAAPLDMLLGAAALGIGRRMLPDRSWLEFGAGLIRQPRFALDRGPQPGCRVDRNRARYVYPQPRWV
jgi:hypothetical protein